MAPPFDLNIRFTGICGFVPNNDPQGQFSLGVVMPGTDQARQALDGELLCPHESYVGFYAPEPWPPPSPEPPPLLTVPLKNCRVALVTSHSGSPSLPVSTSPYLLNLQDLIGTYAAIDAAIVNSNPPSPVMVQVLLGDGTITYLPDTTTNWDVGSMDGGSAATKVDLVHEVVLSLTSVTSAHLTGATFDGVTKIDIDLDPAQVPGAAFVRIVNVCTATSIQVLRDRDFKWYFELLNSGARQAIVNELSKLRTDLPFPIVRAHLIGGQDCFPARLPAVTFGP